MVVVTSDALPVPNTVWVLPPGMRCFFFWLSPATRIAADPDAVARVALRALDRGTPKVYAPGIWRWIMLVIRLLPRFVMRRVGF